MIFGEGLLLLVGDAPKVANVEVPTPDFFFEAWSRVATKIFEDSFQTTPLSKRFL